MASLITTWNLQYSRASNSFDPKVILLRFKPLELIVHCVPNKPSALFTKTKTKVHF